MTVAELLVKCLENEGVKYIFGVPGEENLDVMDALLSSSIQFVTTRHEQGAAFMADVYGRLTGKAGVCLATLGPGATNLMTGVADAQLDRAPLVAIAGQAATTRLHKESHQVVNLVEMFAPIAKYSTQVLEPTVIAEVVRKAFKVAQAEKPGVSFIDLPENIAALELNASKPLLAQAPQPPIPPVEKIKQAAEIISQSRYPLIMVGNGVIRSHATEALQRFIDKLSIPVATTFMAKGVIPFSHPLSLGTVGLQAQDYVSCAFKKADTIICIGFDMVEYHPYLWHGDKDKKIIHIDASPAEVDEHYILSCGVVGNINAALDQMSEWVKQPCTWDIAALRQTIVEEMTQYKDDNNFPLKPQKIVWDLRQALDANAIVLSDVGAHKMWMARMYQAEQPNTCLISNGFAAMGISLPGAIAAKLVHPDRTVVAVTGDAGFLMNSQEIETALRINTPIIILIWNDQSYGLIKWKQNIHFQRESHVDFTNPDFVKYAESFGAKGYRIQSVDEFLPTLKQAIIDDTVVIIDCAVDYSENMKLTNKLANLACDI